MTEKWFLDDIKRLLQHRSKVVLLDPARQCGFLLPFLQQNQLHVIQTNPDLQERWQQEKEELMIRFEAETTYKNKPVVFYVTRPQEKLSFLLDYCFTHGLLDLSHPQEWLKRKIFLSTGLQVPLDNPMIITAAKIGVGKDLVWWKKILQNLADLVDIEQELLPFLHDQEAYLSHLESDVHRLFKERLFELIEQPYLDKPWGTLANEIVKMLFNGLAFNVIKPSLLQLYYRWADSDAYRQSLEDYLVDHKPDSGASPWSAHPDHCFSTLDLQALKQITGNLNDATYVKEKLGKIKPRVTSRKVSRFVPLWWHDVITLLEFDSAPLSQCNSFEKVVSYYINQFCSIDRAMRHLYVSFLQEDAIIRPLQERYESLMHELLQQWYLFAGDYKTDQPGHLVNLMRHASPGIAVIVGDGIRYEIADTVATALSKQFLIERKHMLADMPSETEHNMSALYSGSLVFSNHKDREKHLLEASGRTIKFMSLEALHYGTKVEYLVLTYRDIDSSGEKLQHGALKLFEEFEHVLAEKITMLLNMGYKEVHLVTDHGFVLTGKLDEADKVDPPATGKKKVYERYIRTVDKQENEDLIGFQEPYEEYNYVYTARNHRPFRSKGVYGYSHGGFTPQEIVIPNFIFRKAKDVVPGLQVKIANKEEMQEVIGELFSVKLKGAPSASDLFASSRKVQVLLYAGTDNFASSSIINIDGGATEALEFSLKGHKEVHLVVLDAASQEQLDSVIVKQSNLRDLGGL